MATKCPETYTIEINQEKLVFDCEKRGKHTYHKSSLGLRAQLEWLSDDDFLAGMQALAKIKGESKS